MRLFRGISVAHSKLTGTLADICQNGLVGGRGTWAMEHECPSDPVALRKKPDLSLNDTRPGINSVAAVCASGDELGASYYASVHNITAERDTAIVIEFEAPASVVAVDGKDFLYPAFQGDPPERARPLLKRIYGGAVLPYADAAWGSSDQLFRIAQCDLAIHDAEVIAAHHENELLLGGRHNTHFRSAFTVALPIAPESILRAREIGPISGFPVPDVLLHGILRPRA